MTLITFSDGKIVMRDGKVGTERSCCCKPCCPCSSLDPPFVDSSCDLQAVIVAFDLSLLGPCQGAATMQLEATDVDLGFAFSKEQTVATSGGDIRVRAYVWCEDGCIAVRFEVITDECNFCLPGSGLGVTGAVLLAGVNNESEVCCPVGATYRYGPFGPLDMPPMSLCPFVEVSIEVTCVY